MTKKIIGVLLALCALTTSYAQDNNRHNFDVTKNLEVFNTVYKYLDMMYVDTLNANEVVRYGLGAMLNSLDPYTVYYPADDTKELDLMLTGRYGGIGAIIRYDLVRKTVVIDEPYEDTPAAKAGLRKGDVIVSIDDSTMTGKPAAYVSSRLRGDAGSTFEIKIMRPSTGKTFRKIITREQIQQPAVAYYGVQPGGIGYLCLTSYTENCARDVRRAVLDMKHQGMKSLVLDLRGNGGGSVQEAISIVNMFVPKGETILTMKGKIKQANREFTTKVEPIDTVMPIVVLVNDQTASASEITCGSLQDLDRAVVMGTRTFGKGLMQSTFDLPYNGVIKLTTSKYYIPSGRCIQAINYRHGRGGYTEHIPDSLTHTFTTRHGRIVRDGGGIKPDIEVLPDSLPNIAFYLASTGLDSTEAMLNWEVKYLKEHKTIAPAATFELSDADYEDFKAFVIQSGFKYDRESEKQLKNLVKLAKFEGYYDDARAEFDALEQRLNHNLAKDLDHNKEVIKAILAGDIVAAYYFQRGSVENKLLHDKQWKEAVKLLNDMDRYQRTLQPAPQEETAKTEGQTAKTEVTAEP